MRTLATLTRTTKRGLTSIWHFVQAEDGCYAFGGCHVPLIKRFDSIDELRDLYRSYLSYGYGPITKQQATPTPPVSVLPADLQSDLWALTPVG